MVRYRKYLGTTKKSFEKKIKIKTWWLDDGKFWLNFQHHLKYIHIYYKLKMLIGYLLAESS